MSADFLLNCHLMSSKDIWSQHYTRYNLILELGLILNCMNNLECFLSSPGQSKICNVLHPDHTQILFIFAKPTLTWLAPLHQGHTECEIDVVRVIAFTEVVSLLHLHRKVIVVVAFHAVFHEVKIGRETVSCKLNLFELLLYKSLLKW